MASVQFAPQQESMGDQIQGLPVDQTVPSHNEIQIMDTLFKQKHGVVNKIMAGSKDMLLAGFLFMLFNIPQIDDMIRKLIPTTATSPYILILVKTILFVVTYFIIKNIYTVRK